MKHFYALISLVLMTCGCFGGPAEATENTTRELTLPGNGSIHFTVPKSWQAHPDKTEEGVPVIYFSPPSGPEFVVAIGVIWDPEGKMTPDLKGLKEMVSSSAKEAEASAVEKQVRVQELQGGKVRGYYFKATDRAPKPDEFKYLVEGAAVTSDNLVLTFSIFTNDGQDNVIRQGLAAVSKARHEVTKVSSISKKAGRYRIAVPESSAFLEFPAGSFVVKTEDDARPYYFLSDKKGLNVSFNFERADRCTSSKSCRDYLYKKMQSPDGIQSQWSKSRIDDVFVSEYLIGTVKGVELNAHHLNAHYIVDGVWIDMHLSKAMFQESDRKMFDDFVRSVAVSR